jgi:muramoyltetrapeptide carboxypeptidase
LADPGVAAVVAARGGYGLTRIAHRVDLEGWRAHPKWIVGFSDITALHVEAWRAGIASLHAENAAGLGRGDAIGRRRFRYALEHPEAPRSYTDLRSWVPGAARGPLVGGNLTLLFTCAAAGRLRFPPSAIVILEDVTEASYRVDRMLSALIASGAFDDIAGVVVGDFTDCLPGQHRVSTDSVLRERLSELGVPVVSGLPFGHDVRNDPIAFGAEAELDATRGTLQIAGL